MRNRTFALGLVLAAALTACSIKFPLTGRFENGETFQGTIDSNLAGSAVIDAQSSSGARCSGNSRITFKPAYSAIIPCVGQRGVAELRCSDGRRVTGNWTATGCTSGYGDGYDQDGNRLVFAMGMSLDEALKHQAESGVGRPVAGRQNPPAPGRTAGNGTGFFVTADGYIVTNAHVARRDSRLSLLQHGREVPLRVVDVDPTHDLALVKADIPGRPLAVAVGPPAKGEDVAALGYPVADKLGTELKATFGKVNALSGIGGDRRLIQVDAPVQPGSSGGPLLDMRGVVVGIVTATYSTAANARRTGGALPQNVNYAVKSEFLVPLLERNIAGKWRRAGGPRFASTADLVRLREPSVVLILVR